MVFNNGEPIERAAYVWAESLDDLMMNSSFKLHKQNRVKILYRTNGDQVCYVIITLFYLWATCK